jgi:mono/diheme cytochrome c family protein
MLETVKNPAKTLKAFVWFMLVAFFATISINSSAQTGEELFKANCSACHKLTADKFVGPGLKDVGQRRTQEWLLAWTKNSQELIASGDSIAVAIFKEYNSSIMTPFDFLGDSAILSIFDFIATGPAEAAPVDTVATAAAAPAELTTPAEPVDAGSEVIFWFVVVVVILIIWVLYSTFKSVHKAMDENGYLGYKDPNTDYLKTFLVMLRSNFFGDLPVERLR